ncbi:MAG: CoB--CoM heterodisulfide reductase iron-sulfur subunit A family protein [Anaerolineales bacterium]|jgi:heterodisulfide reductase subunit A
MPEKTSKPEKQKPPTQVSEEEKPRIGVYTCYCGGNIGDVVDVDRVAKVLGDEPNVIVSRTDLSMCSDAGQSMIEKDIHEHNLNRVVIGSCSPFLHEQTFRGAVSRGGLNPYFYQHVGIREQDSWVTHDDHKGATAKAIRLMRAGVAKACHLEALEPIRLQAQKHALVIGGGVAGLRAALDIARRGLKVTLIEKSPFLGGHMAQLEGVFPTDQEARPALHEMMEKVVQHPNVTIYTSTELVGVQGYVGDFQVELRQEARGVSGDARDIQAAVDICPVEVLDEFNYGLTKRKAIYRRYPGCYPQTAAIDWEHCTLCGECAKLNPKHVHLERQPKTFQLTVGAIVIATGFKPYEPRPGEYGFSEFPEVVTLPQFIRIMAMADGKPELSWNNHPVRQIAMIHCVGSRQVEGVHEPQPDGKVNDYCSRVCCTATLHATVDLHRRYPQIHVFDIYEDIRTYGRGHEEYYKQASLNGVRFLRFHAEEGPSIVSNMADDGHPLVVKVKDYLTWGEELEVPADLVVLAVGMMPDPVEDLIDLLKVSPGSDRFLLEVHPKLRPVETAVTGIILAGTAQSPMNIQESCAAAEAAAAKVSGLLSQGRVELEPFVARVDLGRCTGTGACVEACQYEGAIRLEMKIIDGQEVQRAVVSPANCVGCGVCVSVCPNRALDVQGWTLGQYEAMVEAIATDIPEMAEVGV